MPGAFRLIEQTGEEFHIRGMPTAWKGTTLENSSCS
jgi:hypothetical protein